MADKNHIAEDGTCMDEGAMCEQCAAKYCPFDNAGDDDGAEYYPMSFGITPMSEVYKGSRGKFLKF